MSEEKNKRKLIEKLREHLVVVLESEIPEKGPIKPYVVTMPWPGTKYVARTMIEFKSSIPGLAGHVLRVGMHEKNSDRMVSHFLVDGGNTDLVWWFKSQNSAEELLQEFESLKESVDDLDD